MGWISRSMAHREILRSNVETGKEETSLMLIARVPSHRVASS